VSKAHRAHREHKVLSALREHKEPKVLLDTLDRKGYKELKDSRVQSVTPDHRACKVHKVRKGYKAP
jgi:hypothetical protein